MGSATPIPTPKSAVAAIRVRKRADRVQSLRKNAEQLLREHPGSSLWLFGSPARGDWDAFSDVDVLVVAPERTRAEQLANDVLASGIADDVLALTLQEWDQRQHDSDPYWSAIVQDALCLATR